jgi:hypothetical protein
MDPARPSFKTATETETAAADKGPTERESQPETNWRGRFETGSIASVLCCCCCWLQTETCCFIRQNGDRAATGKEAASGDTSVEAAPERR